MTATTLTRPAPVSARPWMTATLRPAGALNDRDADRLAEILDALTAAASLVVVDLEAAQLRGRAAAAAIDAAALGLEGRGGCLLCVHVDARSRHALADSHAIVLDELPA